MPENSFSKDGPRGKPILSVQIVVTLQATIPSSGRTETRMNLIRRYLLGHLSYHAHGLAETTFAVGNLLKMKELCSQVSTFTVMVPL
jgi:hypothetical protein